MRSAVRKARAEACSASSVVRASVLALSRERPFALLLDRKLCGDVKGDAADTSKGEVASEVITTGLLRTAVGLLDAEDEGRLLSIDGPIGTVPRRTTPRFPALEGRRRCGR